MPRAANQWDAPESYVAKPQANVPSVAGEVVGQFTDMIVKQGLLKQADDQRREYQLEDRAYDEDVRKEDRDVRRQEREEDRKYRDDVRLRDRALDASIKQKDREYLSDLEDTKYKRGSALREAKLKKELAQAGSYDRTNRPKDRIVNPKEVYNQRLIELEDAESELRKLYEIKDSMFADDDNLTNYEGKPVDMTQALIDARKRVKRLKRDVTRLEKPAPKFKMKRVN